MGAGEGRPWPASWADERGQRSLATPRPCATPTLFGMRLPSTVLNGTRAASSPARPCHFTSARPGTDGTWLPTWLPFAQAQRRRSPASRPLPVSPPPPPSRAPAGRPRTGARMGQASGTTWTWPASRRHLRRPPPETTRVWLTGLRMPSRRRPPDLPLPSLLRVCKTHVCYASHPAGTSSWRSRRPAEFVCFARPIGATQAAQNEVFASGLEGPFGIAFYPSGPNPEWVYVAETNRVVRFPYRSGDLRARGAPETVVPRLAPTTGGHDTRDIVFSLDGKRMFVSVGSGSNVAEGMRTKSADAVRAWEGTHGLGAAWGDEENRADVLVFTPDGKEGRTFASGLRNCVGMAVQPSTGALWCSTNERDGLGDDLVPDYVTQRPRGRLLRLALVLPREPRRAASARPAAGLGQQRRRCRTCCFRHTRPRWK